MFLYLLFILQSGIIIYLYTVIYKTHNLLKHIQQQSRTIENLFYMYKNEMKFMINEIVILKNTIENNLNNSHLISSN